MTEHPQPPPDPPTPADETPTATSGLNDIPDEAACDVPTLAFIMQRTPLGQSLDDCSELAVGELIAATAADELARRFGLEALDDDTTRRIAATSAWRALEVDPTARFLLEAIIAGRIACPRADSRDKPAPSLQQGLRALAETLAP